MFPTWLAKEDPKLSLRHISPVDKKLEEILRSDVVEDTQCGRFTENPDKDMELYYSISSIFQSCQHVRALLLRQQPTEMDRRISIDNVIARVCGYGENPTVQYSTKQKLKLPKARGFKVPTTTADGVMHLDMPGFRPYVVSAELREYGSALVPGPLNHLQVIHSVAEFKRGGGGTNQALMGIVSGLYQKKVLNIAHQPVFGIFHHEVDIFQVLAGVWQNGWISVYHVGNYSIRDPLQTVQFYLVIRAIRKLGQSYGEQLRKSEREIIVRIEDREPVDEWATDCIDSISEYPNEPDTHMHGGSGPNTQSGWAYDLSTLGHWDTRNRVLSYLKSMSDHDSSSSGEVDDYPESPPLRATQSG